MFNAIIKFSLENKLLIGLAVLALIISGLYSAREIPLDAVPDITNNQVQIVTSAPTFAPEEVEQLITYPLESGMTNLPKVTEVRSISRYGLSVITVVFKDEVEMLKARQYVQEQLNMAVSDLPPEIFPELMPITTGLGEIYQYVLTVEDEYKSRYDAIKLRTIQDWIVKRQLNGTEGIIETSSFGGYLKQYEIAINPILLKNYGLNINDVINALKRNNQNSGGSYIEKDNYSFYIRMEGRMQNMLEIENTFIHLHNNVPILIKDVADVRIGSAKRYGAMTMDGKGEVVGGITLMLKGANSSEALANVKARVDEIKNNLPEGISIYPYLDRSRLIDKTIQTATKNLLEGGLIVIFVLLLLLGNFRAGLIVASVIPLSMLFALSMMRIFGISANLMSLGAIDFGIVVDGAVIIVESLLHILGISYVGSRLTQNEMDDIVVSSTSKIYRSAAFGVLIILLVFIPILTLDGTEGKTFRPMAQTVAFAILGSLFLSITYVPVMCSLFINKNIKAESGIAFRIINFLKTVYTPVLRTALKRSYITVALAVLAFVFSIIHFMSMGAEFIPTLEEGDIAMQQAIKPGSSLEESIKASSLAEKTILENFPEVLHVVSKIGTAEVPTDPMAIEDADVMIILKDKEDWVSAKSREELMSKMKEKLSFITWASYEFTQPIQLRFNELMTGSKSDISVKIFGENTRTLKALADSAAEIIEGIQGASDVKVDQTDGLKQLSVNYDRSAMAQYGVNIDDVNELLRAAYAGEKVGDIYEEERRFDLVVRLLPEFRQNLDLNQFTVNSARDNEMSISNFASVEQKESPMLISREQARRFINIGINVRNRDIASLVAEIQSTLNEELDVPAGYELQYGGQFENLEHARQRLFIAVPVALALILLLLYLAFKNITDVLIIFMAVPLSAIGGILALSLRSMPFSISSGIGFIALFGISVLNGIVLLTSIKQKSETANMSKIEFIMDASVTRLRPVIMTALVAAFGFLPMAISNGSGAEVQRPLATVVIGGLISSSILTLIVLPVLYKLFGKYKMLTQSLLIVLTFGFMANNAYGQKTYQSFDDILEYALSNHPSLESQYLMSSRKRLEKQSVGKLDRTQFNYSGGDINYDGYDNHFSVNQNISSLFNTSQQKQLIESDALLIDWENVLMANELKYSLLYQYQLFTKYCSIENILANSISILEDLDNTMASRLKSGEISQMESNYYKIRIYDYRHRTQLNQLLKNESMIDLKSLAFLGVEDTVVSINIMPIENVSVEFDKDRSMYFETYALKQKILNDKLSLEVSSINRPDINIRLFSQSLEKQYGFHGFEIGLAIPLDRRNKKVIQQQKSIDEGIIENDLIQLENNFQLRLEMLKFKLERYGKLIEDYDKNILLDNKNILRSAEKQFDRGEIDLLDFFKIYQDVIDNELKYIETIHSYNSIVIQISYLTQKKSDNEN